MKVENFVIVILLAFLLSSCAVGAGEIVKKTDEFKGTTSELLALGSVTRINDSNSVISDDTLMIGCEQKNCTQLYLELNTYTESLGGGGCPGISVNDQVIFMNNNFKYNSKVLTRPSLRERQPGALAPSCYENNVKIGYFKKSDLEKLISDGEMKFRVYSLHYPLDVMLTPEQMKLIKDYITGKVFSPTKGWFE